VDTESFTWKNYAWKGLPWSKTVLYELHVGTFTPEGTYDGVRARLPYLKELGVTAIELMPLADFPGRRNWGYDGVLPFAPDSVYGTSRELQRMIDAAHGMGIMEICGVRPNQEKKGTVIGVNDLHIAAHARSEGLVLVSNNVREFERVEGLRLENWIESK